MIHPIAGTVKANELGDQPPIGNIFRTTHDDAQHALSEVSQITDSPVSQLINDMIEQTVNNSNLPIIITRADGKVFSAATEPRLDSSTSHSSAQALLARDSRMYLITMPDTPLDLGTADDEILESNTMKLRLLRALASNPNNQVIAPIFERQTDPQAKFEIQTHLFNEVDNSSNHPPISVRPLDLSKAEDLKTMEDIIAAGTVAAS